MDYVPFIIGGVALIIVGITLFIYLLTKQSTRQVQKIQRDHAVPSQYTVVANPFQSMLAPAQ